MRKEILKFLNDAKEHSGLSYSAISANAGISPSTITRFIKSDEIKELSLNSLNKIAEACGFISYQNYLSSTKNSKKIKITDSLKFETYEIARKILMSKNRKTSNAEIADTTQEVINHAEKLGTDFITDSLVMYVIERRENKK